MMRRLDRFWYWMLYTANRWILGRVFEHCRREQMRGPKEHSRREARRRFREELAWQKAHLN